MIKKLDYTLYAFTSGNKVFVELDQRILKIKWYGIVTEASVKEVAKHCNELISSNLINRIIIDRTELVMFSAMAMNSLFLAFSINSQSKKCKFVKKIAIISSKNPESIELECGLNGALVQGFPTADIRSFRSPGPASLWIIER